MFEANTSKHFTMVLSFIALFSTLVSFSTDVNPSNINASSHEFEMVDGDYYSLIGRTEKGYGQEYTINLRVEATCYGSSCTIQGVDVATNNGYVNVSYQMDYSRSNRYKVSHGGETYYFSFS